jgi:hypothetical protein
VRALEVAQRGRFIRAQPVPPGLQEKQLERLAQDRRRLRDIEAATDQAMETLAKRSAQLAVELAGKILQPQIMLVAVTP